MSTQPDVELLRIREARQQISEEFHHDPELIIGHYINLQKRHQDRLIRSTEVGMQESPKDAQCNEP